MAFRFGIDLIGSEELEGYSSRLFSLAKVFSTNPWGAMLQDIGMYFVDTIEQQFATEGAFKGDYSGRPWLPLTTKYAEYKQDKVGFMPILQFTGEYADSWGFDFIEADAIIIRSNRGDDLVAVHQLGTNPRVVERPALIVTESDLHYIDERFAAEFDSKFFTWLE